MSIDNLKNQFSIKWYLDIRRAKTNGLYPLKLRIWTKATRTAEFFSTKYEFTPEQWELIQKQKKSEHRDILRELNIFLEFAIAEANNIIPFEAKKLINILNNPNNSRATLKHLFDAKISTLSKEKINTIKEYKKVFKSLSSCKKDKIILISDINTLWINQYIAYCTNELNHKPSTIRTYLQLFRSVYNYAINNELIKRPDKDPFFKIDKPKQNSSQNTALTIIELNTLRNFEFKDYEMEMQYTRDIFLIMYYCGGLAPIDLFNLKYSNIQTTGGGEFIRTKRQKTGMPINIPYSNILKNYVDIYGTPKEHGKDHYIFKLFNLNDTPEAKAKKISSKTTRLSTILKRIAILTGINNNISPYWARHTFATLASRDGMAINAIKESLGHSDIKTTQFYLNSLGETEHAKLMSDFFERN